MSLSSLSQCLSPEPKVHFRALARIARGEEIWSSYTPLGWPLHEPPASPPPPPAEEDEEEEEEEEEEVSRARHLASNYGFQCGCRRCLIEDGKAAEAPGEGEGEEPQLRLTLWLLRHDPRPPGAVKCP
jgi:hypothetical protein